MAKNTSVSLGTYFDKFINDMIEEGRYKNASEIIRAGLRLLDEEERQIKALRVAIQEGLDSGIVKNFNPEQFLDELNDRQRSNAKD